VYSLNNLKVGLTYKKKFIFKKNLVIKFGEIADDNAPIHMNLNFAKKRGLKKNIVHGFYISSIFSGILGEKLPGPKTVINTLNLKFHEKVFIDEEIIFKVKIHSLVKSVKAVVLSLNAINNKKKIVISGDCICSFI
jgi:acyl dehydratase